MSTVAPGQAQPSLNVVAQYVKDFSFENPRAPDSLRPKDGGPQITVGVNVQSRQRSGVEFEVDLKLEVSATQGEETVFHIELDYGGLFRVQNVPQQHLHPFVMIECPRLLFPFARQIVADAAVRGGFPPLMIDPIDFVALYQQYVQQMQQQAQQGQAPN
ncbi:protein-export chaperone SecB [Oharaeibacter diazotrophicus]|uniref:Protein-export protein SecB n=1 Tax=Oharaeibacter diazotrophicus TaxID=1920512 RepID=A0A4R6RDK3_9HYPH|nr:protein-export chaperone SecB [Oharaeibacter diazotrophicus]TDP84283.1 protein translocase subunit secB [Oharaeibacter diazotrophicus]BBE73320.1 protein-export protein SecB [Pleomorphomonas sp. SM30]GLS75111.1 protein-export protein SecB [Oharaeibacter diazotrophicus]